MGLLLMEATPHTQMDNVYYIPSAEDFQMVFKSGQCFMMDDRRHLPPQERIVGHFTVDERRRARNRLAQRKHRQRKREAQQNQQQQSSSTPDTTTSSIIPSDSRSETSVYIQPEDLPSAFLPPGTPNPARSVQHMPRSPSPEESLLDTPRSIEELAVSSTLVHQELPPFPTQPWPIENDNTNLLDEFQDFFTTAGTVTTVPAWTTNPSTEIIDPWIPPFPEELLFPVVPTQSSSWPSSAAVSQETPQPRSHFPPASEITHHLPALHAAAHQGNETAVRHLLQSANIISTLDELDHGGWTALHHAASGGHVGTVSALLENGADYNIVDRLGWTALQVATGRGHDDVVALMAEFGVS